MQAPSWQKLLASKIETHDPRYSAQPLSDGNLKVMRPSLPDVQVEVNDIAQFCQRGPKDCDYAIEQMLLHLHSR